MAICQIILTEFISLIIDILIFYLSFGDNRMKISSNQFYHAMCMTSKYHYDIRLS